MCSPARSHMFSTRWPLHIYSTIHAPQFDDNKLSTYLIATNIDTQKCWMQLITCESVVEHMNLILSRRCLYNEAPAIF